MTDSVQQTRDGNLVVHGGTSMYVDTFANAATDYGVATPALASGAIDRVYEVSIRHAMTDGKTIVAAGPIPWSQGDSYIANIATAIANQKARQPPVGVPGVLGHA